MDLSAPLPNTLGFPLWNTLFLNHSPTVHNRQFLPITTTDSACYLRLLVPWAHTHLFSYPPNDKHVPVTGDAARNFRHHCTHISQSASACFLFQLPPTFLPLPSLHTLFPACIHSHPSNSCLLLASSVLCTSVFPGRNQPWKTSSLSLQRPPSTWVLAQQPGWNHSAILRHRWFLLLTWEIILYGSGLFLPSQRRWLSQIELQLTSKFKSLSH